LFVWFPFQALPIQGTYWSIRHKSNKIRHLSLKCSQSPNQTPAPLMHNSTQQLVWDMGMDRAINCSLGPPSDTRSIMTIGRRRSGVTSVHSHHCHLLLPFWGCPGITMLLCVPAGCYITAVVTHTDLSLSTNTNDIWRVLGLLYDFLLGFFSSNLLDVLKINAIQCYVMPIMAQTGLSPSTNTNDIWWILVYYVTSCLQKVFRVFGFCPKC